MNIWQIADYKKNKKVSKWGPSHHWNYSKGSDGEH